MSALLLERIGSPLLGIILPAIILGLSFWVAWAMFKKFTKQ
ncbi:MAG: hypothetical protein OEV30_12675 [Ignavibacteria bacterium]|nr:hypothetical protein [Ignavibacteria bacterium]